MFYGINIYSEIGWELPTPIHVQIDNQSAIAMAKGTAKSKRSRHISVREAFLRLHTQDGTIKPVYVRSEENPADHFTKILVGAIFIKHRETLMGKPNNDQFLMTTPFTTNSFRSKGERWNSETHQKKKEQKKKKKKQN
jgi:hypothetical protein